ncbi:MAG: response regulator [Chloroflexaceae bacterium]|jgi:putative two-component system response regulator|nr:response regulator [Chloroflexaceae bacterium]
MRCTSEQAPFAQPATPAAKRNEGEQGDTSHILIVDDSLAMAHALTQIVDECGYSSKIATTGREALRIVSQQPPDLILLDLHLPDISGLEICAQLKQDEATRLIPIIIVTAHADRKAQLKCIEAGAEGYLQKPVDVQELDLRLKALLRAKRLNDTLEPAENVIFALARMVESKDTYTEGHLQRLAYYATVIGERLGLTGTALMALRYGSLLHDVGKVGIDETIIRKPGPLTTAEYKLMQQHTLIGERIVAPLRMAARIAPIVRGHHERWDGSGYPDGLVGENIPLGARIVAVADAYDAMTTQRSYNQVLTPAAAAQRLRDGAGSIFDPLVVDIFVAWLEEQGEVQLERQMGAD